MEKKKKKKKETEMRRGHAQPFGFWNHNRSLVSFLLVLYILISPVAEKGAVGGGGGGGGGSIQPSNFASGQKMKAPPLFIISRNGPYIGGHLAFYFKLNFKHF